MRYWLLILLIVTHQSFAFGPIGHKVVGQIAQERLTPEAEKLVKLLLAADVANDLAGVAIWADAIKRDKAYEWSKSMHYVNFADDAKRYDPQRDCVKDSCIVAAIGRFRAEMANVALPLPQRTNALKFLVHFVGDIHQPLHAGRQEDLGGNKLKVKWFGDKQRLHWVWDTGLLQRHHKNWQDHATQLSQSISQSQKSQWIEQMVVGQWAIHSSKLALSNAYDIPKDKKLGRLYYKKNLPLIQLQLQKAGVRLAEMINQVSVDLSK